VREFEWPFEEGLRKGLRIEEFSPAREQQLVECWNLRPRQTGLLPVVDITNPFAQSISWPFPQVLVGRNFRLLADQSTIYTCDDSWVTTAMLTGLVVGDCWDWAEFGDFILMTNGEQMVQRNGSTGVWSSFVSSGNIPGMKTLCNYRGQIVGGNITTAWHNCGSNYVVWSDIGSADFTPGIKNEAGYTIMPFNGEVLRVLPLGEHVIVYCENGIVIMKPAQQYFASAELLPVGIPSKGAVVGNDQGHLFVDYNGELWMIKPGPKVQKLGYQEFISTLDASKLMISHNSGEDEYYISDGSYTFIMTPSGLCQTYQLPTSLAFVDGQLIGVSSNGSDSEGRIVTDLVDFGIRSFKTVSVLEIGGFSSAGFRACVDWRSNNTGAFQRSIWLVSNPTGFVTPVVTAHDFRLCVKSSSYNDMELRYVIARVKNVDRRAMRGVPVSGPGLRR
jgi:hypothetical protein